HDDPEGNLHIIGVLPMEEAKGVLGAWSKGRTGDEAISEAICTLLGCLPLALRLAGSYIVTRNFTAPEYLELLQETPLTALHLEARQHKSVEVLLHKSVEQLDESVLQTLAV